MEDKSQKLRHMTPEESSEQPLVLLAVKTNCMRLMIECSAFAIVASEGSAYAQALPICMQHCNLTTHTSASLQLLRMQI
jgi:hypothetical protein